MYGGSASGVRYASAVFALNLSKFRQYESHFSNGNQSMSVSSYVTTHNSTTVNILDSVDYWIFASWNNSTGNSVNGIRSIIQVDGQMQPPGDELPYSEYYYRGLWSIPRDTMMLSHQTMESFSVGAFRTIDVKGNSYAGGGSNNRFLLILSTAIKAQ